MTATVIPVTTMRGIEATSDGRRESFAIGYVGTVEYGWLFVRTTYPDAMTVKAWAGTAAPKPIQIEWLFGITDFDMSAAIARAIGEVMGVEA